MGQVCVSASASRDGLGSDRGRAGGGFQQGSALSLRLHCWINGFSHYQAAPMPGILVSVLQPVQQREQRSPGLYSAAPAGADLKKDGAVAGYPRLVESCPSGWKPGGAGADGQGRVVVEKTGRTAGRVGDPAAADALALDLCSRMENFCGAA